MQKRKTFKKISGRKQKKTIKQRGGVTVVHDYRNTTGDIYDGEWEDGKPNGKGTMKYSYGSVYNGEWKNGKSNGKGKMVYAKGDIYDGEWEDGKLKGKGIMKYLYGNVYDGEWEDSKKHGKGVMTFSNGDVYNGDWINGKKEGKGVMTFANGSVYEGDWEDGDKHGKGIMKYASGDIYEGDWQDGEKNGKGKMTFTNGEFYDGDWQDGERYGSGTMTYANGDVYEGDWSYDMINDVGIMKYANGDVYEGEWDINRKEGKGKMTYANGDVYEGDWSVNMKDGTGIMKYANGDVYEGNWQNDRKEGYGILTLANGDVQQGDWVNNVLNGVRDIIDPNEIHTHFNQKFEKTSEEYYKIIKPFTKPDKDYIENENLVQDIRQKLRNHIDSADFIINGSTKTEIKRQLDAIMNRIELTTYVKEPETKILMGKTIDFIFGIKDKEFTQTYISMFITDCYHAYNYETIEDPNVNISCPKGIIERFYFLIGDTAYAICPETCPDTKNHVIYDRLKLLFGKKMMDKNALLQEWAERLEDENFKKLSEKERKKDFIDFMITKYEEAGMYSDKIKDEIEKEAEKYDYVFKTLSFGGKKTKKRKLVKKQNKKTRKNATKK